METGIVTIKGQVVIPAKIRRRLGITQGTKICFIESGDDLIIKPLSKDYFEKMAGLLKTGGKMANKLLTARKQERAAED